MWHVPLIDDPPFGKFGRQLLRSHFEPRRQLPVGRLLDHAQRDKPLDMTTHLLSCPLVHEAGNTADASRMVLNVKVPVPRLPGLEGSLVRIAAPKNGHRGLPLSEEPCGRTFANSAAGGTLRHV